MHESHYKFYKQLGFMEYVLSLLKLQPALIIRKLQTSLKSCIQELSWFFLKKNINNTETNICDVSRHKSLIKTVEKIVTKGKIYSFKHDIGYMNKTFKMHTEKNCSYFCGNYHQTFGIRNEKLLLSRILIFFYRQVSIMQINL